MVSMSAVAPMVAGWPFPIGGGQAGPLSIASASGATSNQLVRVELLIDGIWQDITSLVMVRDSGNISIQRGQMSEGSGPEPGSCNLQLNNRDGRFSPSNPNGIYYGKIGRNTQLRVSVPSGDDPNYRFWGEVAEWPEDWDLTDTDRWVDVTAAGILRRLRQNTTPLHSSLYRGVTSSFSTPTPVAYWPLEDGQQSTSLASATGGASMTFFGGSPTLASDTGFNCSDALPVMNSAGISGAIPSYTVTGQSRFRFLLFLPTAPADGTVLVEAQATGTVAKWQVVYGTGGSLALFGLDSAGVTVEASGPITFGVLNRRCQVSISLTQNGADVDWKISTADATTGGILALTSTFTAQTVGRLSVIRVSPATVLTDSVFGHVYVQSSTFDDGDLPGPVSAWVGENVVARILRLCSEEGIDNTAFAIRSPDTMGPQRPNQFLALLQECVDVDQGTLFEREVSFGLAYISRTAMYNQAATVGFRYDLAQLSDVPRPMPDAKLVQNSVTASRPNGSSAIFTKLTGSLSVQPPPLGVGAYADAPTLNVQKDSDLINHAAWRVHLGTVDEPRYPAISVNLARTEAIPQRVFALHTIFGQRILVNGVPTRLGGNLSLIVTGMQESLTLFEHRITFVCVPASPYEVATVEGSRNQHVGSQSSQLASDMTPTSTTVSVATLLGPIWTTAAGDFPFNILAAGETMTVTNIAGATSPQTFTVTRSVNGIVKTHQAGESLDLASPAIVAL